MANEIRRVSRGRSLSASEAKKYDELRKQVGRDKPAILARRKAQAAVVEGVLNELKQAREAAGLSLADIRDRTGMDRSAIAKLENGARANPTLETLVRYAAAVGKRLVVQVTD